MSYINGANELFLFVSLLLTISLLYCFPRASFAVWHCIMEGVEDYKRRLGLEKTKSEDKKFVEIDMRGLR